MKKKIEEKSFICYIARETHWWALASGGCAAPRLLQNRFRCRWYDAR